MSFVFINYSTVQDLIAAFRALGRNSFTASASDANFVLIDPESYYGTYGGLLKHVSSITQPHRLVEPIDGTFSIIWWLMDDVPSYRMGSLELEAEDGRVLIPKNLFVKLVRRGRHRNRNLCHSSYYPRKALAIKLRSFVNSDSE